MRSVYLPIKESMVRDTKSVPSSTSQERIESRMAAPRNMAGPYSTSVSMNLEPNRIMSGPKMAATALELKTAERRRRSRSMAPPEAKNHMDSSWMGEYGICVASVKNEPTATAAITRTTMCFI